MRARTEVFSSGEQCFQKCVSVHSRCETAGPLTKYVNVYESISMNNADFFYVKECCFVMYDPDIKISFWKQLHLCKKLSLFDFLKNINSLINNMHVTYLKFGNTAKIECP